MPTNYVEDYIYDMSVIVNPNYHIDLMTEGTIKAIAQDIEYCIDKLCPVNVYEFRKKVISNIKTSNISGKYKEILEKLK